MVLLPPVAIKQILNFITMIRIGYLDDSPHSIEIFKWAAQKLEGKLDILYFSDYKNVLADIRNGERFDLFFLDVEMPNVNGFEIGGILQQSDIPFAFLTNHPDFALRAFEFEAIDYLIKPVNTESISRVIKKWAKRKKNLTINLESHEKTELPKYKRKDVNINETKFRIQDKGEVTFVEIDEIVFIKKISSLRTKFFLLNGSSMESNQSIRTLESSFIDNKYNHLFRCSKDEIINLFHLKSIKQMQDFAVVRLMGNHELKLLPYRAVILKNHLKFIK